MINICDEFIDKLNKYKYSVLSLNILSLSKHFNEFKLLLSDLENPSIIALQEIWHPKFVKIPGYQLAAPPPPPPYLPSENAIKNNH